MTKQNILHFLNQRLQTLHGTILFGLGLSLVIYLGLGAYDQFSRVFTALFFSISIMWTFHSSKKYGFLKTLEFLAMLPFSFTGSLISLLYHNPVKQPISHILMPVQREEICSTLENLINESHACTLDKYSYEEDGLYIHFKIPYGIHPPYDQITKRAAKILHVPANLIVQSEYAPTNIYYYFSREAMEKLGAYSYEHYPWVTWKKFKERLFLRSST